MHIPGFGRVSFTCISVFIAGIIIVFPGCEEETIQNRESSTGLQTENLILISIDGLRWQEVYTGADPLLIDHEDYVSNADELTGHFWDDDPAARREKLLPFMWNVIAEQGQLYGNRNLGNTMDLTNEYRFSYPGYSELLVGYADPDIDSNAKTPNPNRTVLEFIQNQPGFSGSVAAFASWDVFPYIINSERSGIYVNAGFDYLAESELTEKEQFLNKILPQVPRPWNTVRHNAFTFHYAMEHLKKKNPKLLYLAFDETDEFAHSGNYEGYLNSARQIDAFIKELWEWVQSDPGYRGKTTFVIATDHGRGSEPLDNWRHHGSAIDGAEQVWMAVLGPDTPPAGEVNQPEKLFQNQIAATVAALLGLEYESKLPVGEAIKSVFK
jgi:hypothetical protein